MLTATDVGNVTQGQGVPDHVNGVQYACLDARLPQNYGLGAEGAPPCAVMFVCVLRGGGGGYHLNKCRAVWGGGDKGVSVLAILGVCTGLDFAGTGCSACPMAGGGKYIYYVGVGYLPLSSQLLLLTLGVPPEPAPARFTAGHFWAISMIVKWVGRGGVGWVSGGQAQGLCRRRSSPVPTTPIAPSIHLPMRLMQLTGPSGAWGLLVVAACGGRCSEPPQAFHASCALAFCLLSAAAPYYSLTHPQ